MKNQLYDKIQKQTARQSKLLTEFIEAYSMEEDENKREKILGKIVVIGAYIKRRSNLIFIAEQTGGNRSKISDKRVGVMFQGNDKESGMEPC